MNAMTLEPCPFCGAKDAEVYPFDRSNMDWNVCCGNPGCVTRGDNNYLTKSDAVAAWNRRAHLAQPAQAVDVDSLAQEIRRVDGSHSLGAAALAEALTPFITRALSGEKAGPVMDGVTATDFAMAMRNCGLSLATYATVDREARRLAKERVSLPISPAPHKESQP